MNKPRPKGCDYNIPDPENDRCKVCNPDGLNRTGLKPIKWYGASTTTVIGIRCPKNCKNGLIE